MYHFERADVVDLGLDEFPDGVLLVPYPLVQRGRVRHEVRPVLLQRVQRYTEEKEVLMLIRIFE